MSDESLPTHCTGAPIGSVLSDSVHKLSVNENGVAGTVYDLVLDSSGIGGN